MIVSRNAELPRVNAVFTFTVFGNVPVVMTDDERVPSGVSGHVVVYEGVLAPASSDPEASATPHAPAANRTAVSVDTARTPGRCRIGLHPSVEGQR